MVNNLFRVAGLMLLCTCLFTSQLSAQKKKKDKDEEKEISVYDVDTLIRPIPNNRASFHIAIDREQKRADMADGAEDGMIRFSDDTSFSNLLTRAVLKQVDQLQVMIENMPGKSEDKMMDNQLRIRYLRALTNVVRRYNADPKVDPVYYRKLVTNFREMLIARHEDRLLPFVQQNISMQTLDNVELMEGFPEARAFIYTAMGKREPQIMINRLSEFAKDTFACSIIAEAAKVVPGAVLNFATSTNYTLSGAIKRCSDPLVQTIVQIATQSKAPLKAMPFLSDIYKKRHTIAEIDHIAATPDLYYKNLVRLKLENESLGGDTYTDELRFRGLKYVRTMNDLHDEKDPVRFKCIEGFKPEELYFLMVYGQDEIYTSSFLGTFRRMMERMGEMKGDALFAKVHYDRFRTFIRMCAGYNTLDRFLATMEEEQKTRLLRDFMAGLEKGKEHDLEDAVDVADAFGSIRDEKLANFLKDEVTANYERCAREKSVKGVIVYGLLATLFKGNTSELDLPPINLVPYSSLTDDSGVVYQQFFFYGDEDGKNSYSSFLGNFRDGKWKITTDKYWSVISSTSGNPVVIYANLPIPEPGDEEAQDELTKYLNSRNIHPTIMVHRGHSYHLPLTLEKLTRESRIIMLGSCGGYHNLGTVLDQSPDAHIISSKQTGAMAVNEPIIRAINEQLLAGRDIDWVSVWQGLDSHFQAKRGSLSEMFSDYVPPHKNLGVIFIKAYRRMVNRMEQ
jgi:ribosomal protein L19E